MRTSFLLAAAVLAAAAPSAQAQDATLQAGLRVTRIVATPAQVTLRAGESAPLEIVAVDASGTPVEAELRIRGAGVSWEDGRVRGARGGEFRVIASVVLPADAQGTPATLTIPVTVTWPQVARVGVAPTDPDKRLFAGTRLRYRAEAFFGDGMPHPGATFTWSSSDPSVATVDGWGNVTAHRAGRTTLSAEAEGVRGQVALDVPALSATALEVRGGRAQARQGDVLSFEAVLTGPSGNVTNAPVLWSVHYQPDDTIHAPGAAGLVEDGKFVGEEPGLYTIMASAGGLVGTTTVDVRPRNAVQEVEILGQGSVDNVHTSDLWVYEGRDGRDYAVTGTWGGDGWAYFWDVTNPGAISKTDSIRVDARTVNDVKVSPSGRYAVLGREGASNRRNGVVILDLADPAHPRIASTYDDGLTGGVHNMFATEDYLFALSGGDKYVILDVRDLANPRYVSEYNHPDSRIHDVWVHDGIAYSSEWQNGVVVVDVGNGRWGGTIEKPVFVTNVPYPVGATHAAFPYFQEETGKFYLFLGDEIMAREGAAWGGAGLQRIPQQGGTPSVTSGYIHIIDFTDPENPKDVARYEAKEFGTHNMWIEDDVLHVAYYEGGVRSVDISGELMGNLATQGREIAVYKAFDPHGYVANAPMAWGPQPFKGNLFFSDFNSGLHSVKLKPRQRPIS